MLSTAKLFLFARGTKPVRVIFCLILAALFEGIGIATLMPVLALVSDEESAISKPSREDAAAPTSGYITSAAPILLSRPRPFGASHPLSQLTNGRVVRFCYVCFYMVTETYITNEQPVDWLGSTCALAHLCVCGGGGTARRRRRAA